MAVSGRQNKLLPQAFRFILRSRLSKFHPAAEEPVVVMCAKTAQAFKTQEAEQRSPWRGDPGMQGGSRGNGSGTRASGRNALGVSAASALPAGGRQGSATGQG